MDINVTTDAFSSASTRLRRHCRRIEDVTVFLIKRLKAAHTDFDDVNYDRTLESVMEVKRGVDNLCHSVEKLTKDLKILENIANDYAYGGYDR